MCLVLLVIPLIVFSWLFCFADSFTTDDIVYEWKEKNKTLSESVEIAQFTFKPVSAHQDVSSYVTGTLCVDVSVILAVLIHPLKRLPLKLGLIQTLSRLCSLRPDFGRNADWLPEVESAYSSRGCFREWSVVGGEKDRFCCLFYCFMVLC